MGCLARYLEVPVEALLDRFRPVKQVAFLVHEPAMLDHYHRFINFDEFSDRLASYSFSIDFSLERSGLAKHGDDDSTVGRVIAKKVA